MKEGVKIIVSRGGVGGNDVGVEFRVKGKLYCEGSGEKGMLLCVGEDEGREENIFGGVWGGIVG